MPEVRIRTPFAGTFVLRRLSPLQHPGIVIRQVTSRFTLMGAGGTKGRAPIRGRVKTISDFTREA
jgi:hypothetical protein